MSGIDNRVVEMEFNNKRFEQNVGETMSTLDKLKRALNFDGGTKGIDNVQKASNDFNFSAMEKAVLSISERFSTLGIIGMRVLENITDSAIQAAKKLVSVFTVDPMKEGWGEFELKLGSIQTIMAGTGESLETVNGYLDELNWYADKTIYSFSDMTENIGKFTNAGVELGDAVAAIQGISNAAALAGSNSTQASHAMYNFAQALSSGYVKLIDWKSIEVAGMATVNFKDQLLETAVALGTVTETSDGMYTTLSGNTFNATRDFNEYLKDQWMTNDVLIQTLAKYSDETTEIGKAAFAAAQDVKTFSQMVDTVKEAMGSGWGATWEIIIGDFDEAKKLFTGMNNVISGFVDHMSDSRNEMLQTWKNLGGRDDTLVGLKNILSTLADVLSTVGQAFRDVFPKMTGERLAELSRQFKELTENFKMGEKTSENLIRTFKGLFSAIDLGVSFITSLVKGFLNLFGVVTPVGGGILELTASIGDLITGFNEGVKASDLFGRALKAGEKVLEPISKLIKSIFGKASNIDTSGFISFFDRFTISLDGFFSVIQKVASVSGTALGKISDFVRELMSNINIGKIMDLINTGLFASLVLGIKKFISSLSDVTGGITSFAEGVNKILDGVIGILDGVRGSLEAWQQSIKAKTILKIATAVGILAASILVLSTIDGEDLAKSLTGITVMMTQLIGALTILEGLSTAKGFSGVGRSVLSIIGLATALLILASAVKKLSDLDYDELGSGLAGVAGMITMIIVASKAMKDTSMIQGSAGLIIFAGAMVVLASAVKKLSEMDTGALAKGLISIGVLLAELSLFSKATSNASGVISTSVGLTILATSLLIFGSAIEKMGSLQIETIGKGLLAMSGSLIVVAGALKLLPTGGMIKSATSLTIIAGALVILANTLSSMGGMEWSEVAIGLTALGGSLLIIATAMKAMTTALAGAAALLVISGALAVLTPVLKTLGNMSLTQIGSALLVLAGTFGVFGLAAMALSPAVAPMLGLSAAIALFGAATLAAGAGVALFSAGISTLAVAATAGAAGITVIFTTISGLIPMILTQLAKGIASFIKVLGDSALTIGEAVTKIIVAIATTIRTGIPEIVTTVIELITTLLRTLADHIPEIVQAGHEILIGLLKGIDDNIEEVTSTAIDIVVKFINTVADKIDDVIQAGVNLIISFVEGLTKAIEDNTDRVTTAMEELIEAMLKAALNVIISPIKGVYNLGKNIVTGIIDGIKGNKKDAETEMSNLGSGMVSSFENRMDMNSPSKVFIGLASQIVDSLSIGLRQNKSAEVASAEKGSAMISATAEGIQSNISAVEAATKQGNNVVDGIATGIKENTSAEDAATEKAKEVVAAFQQQIQEEMSMLDLDYKTSSLEFDLWSGQNTDASELEILSREWTLLVEELTTQQEKMTLALEEYEFLVEQLGKEARETKEAYNTYLQETINFNSLMTSETEKREELVGRSNDAQMDYVTYLSDYSEQLTLLGYTQEQINEAAKNASGYDPTINGITPSIVKDTEMAVGTLQSSLPTFNEAGVNAASAIANGYISKSPEVTTAIHNSVSTGVITAIQTATPSLSSAGQQTVTVITNAITAAQPQINTTVINMTDGMITEITKKVPDFKQAGVDLVDGFIEGIRDNIERAAEEAAAIAAAALAAAKAELDIFSPSGAFAELGLYSVEGFAEGMWNNIEKAKNAGSGTASGFNDAFKKTLEKINDIIKGSINSSPKISPVLDLSNVRSGAGIIGSILSTTALNVGVTASKASKVHSDLNQSSNNKRSSSKESKEETKIEYTQNNYSPKSLSRIDIYRQTKNQLSTLKGVVTS